MGVGVEYRAWPSMVWLILSRRFMSGKFARDDANSQRPIWQTARLSLPLSAPHRDAHAIL